MAHDDIKVTDKRIFTPEGELREEYSHLEDLAPAQDVAAVRETAAAQEPGEPGEPDRAPAADAQRHGGGSSPHLELPPTPGSGAGPTFADLLAVLAEPLSLYLGDVQLPGGESLENLDAARIHIDLLALLRQKTAGNLSAPEATLIDNLLYEVQMRYVQKRG